MVTKQSSTALIRWEEKEKLEKIARIRTPSPMFGVDKRLEDEVTCHILRRYGRIGEERVKRCRESIGTLLFVKAAGH